MWVFVWFYVSSVVSPARRDIFVTSQGTDSYYLAGTTTTTTTTTATVYIIINTYIIVVIIIIVITIIIVIIIIIVNIVIIGGWQAARGQPRAGAQGGTKCHNNMIQCNITYCNELIHDIP